MIEKIDHVGEITIFQKLDILVLDLMKDIIIQKYIKYIMVDLKLQNWRLVCSTTYIQL